MRLKTGLAVLLFTVASTSLAAAQEDVINLRKRVMDVNGQAAKVSSMMIKGDMAFDPVVAAAAATAIGNDAEVFPSLFPAGSESGDTKASPDIWSDMEGLAAAAAALQTAAEAAAGAASEGPEAFGAAFQQVGAACGACHQKYRL